MLLGKLRRTHYSELWPRAQSGDQSGIVKVDRFTALLTLA